MNSKDLTILTERLEKEIERHRVFIRKCEDRRDHKLKEVSLGEVEYHVRMINFIKKLDKELH